MRGHEDLIKLRLQGLKPAWVYINDHKCRTDWRTDGMPATVCVAGEAISSLDMRFLVGLSVVVNADDKQRAVALFEAVKLTGAEFVVAVEHQPGNHYTNQTGWGATWWRPLQKREKQNG